MPPADQPLDGPVPTLAHTADRAAEFIRGSKLDWKGIDDEMRRTYHYPDGSSYTIEEPLLLNVQKAEIGFDRHRVIDARGHGHYVKPGWNAIRWEVKPGHPSIAF